MQQVLDRAAEIYEVLPDEGKEVFYGRLVKEVDHTLERYAFFIPQTSVQPGEAVEKLGLTPPVEEEEVGVTPPGAVVGLTTTPDLPSFQEEGVVDLKGEAVEGTTEESEETEKEDVVYEGSDESESVSETPEESEVTVPEEVTVAEPEEVTTVTEEDKKEESAGLPPL
jgi:hypothetical protein